MNYDVAARTVGVLYGNVLHRDADEAGFNYYLGEFLAGNIVLKDAIKEFYTCPEFIETFVINQTPNELARNLLMSFYNQPSVGSLEVRSLAEELVKGDFASVVYGLIEDDRFKERNGALGVPRYTEVAKTAGATS